MTDNTSLLTASQLLRHNSIDIKSASVDVTPVLRSYDFRNELDIILDAHAGAAGGADADAGAPVADEQTRRTDRWVNFGLDWLTAVFHGANLGDVAAWVMFLLGRDGSIDDFDHHPGGRMLYTETYTGLGGCQIFTKNRDGGDHIAVTMPGQFMQAVALNLLHAGLNHAPGTRQNWSRSDLKWDTNIFTPEQVEQAFEANQVRTVTRRDSLKTILDRHKEQGKTGYTVEVGRRSSERFLRCYGRLDDANDKYTRYEFEAKKERAHLIIEQLKCNPVAEWERLAFGHLLDFAEFDTDWFREFVAGHERAFAKVSDVGAATVAKIRAWVQKAVQSSLNVYFRSIGGDIDALIAFVLDGGSRLSGKQRAALAAAGLL